MRIAVEKRKSLLHSGSHHNKQKQKMRSNMFKKLLIVAFVVLLAPIAALAQTGSLSGRVTDSSTGEPLTGTAVLITELQRGASVDLDGNYRVENLPVGTYTVRFSYVGYRTEVRTTSIQSGNNTLDMLLRVDATGLDEVVITGVGSIERQAFTGAATTVRSERLGNLPIASVDQALMGAVAGLSVNSATGTPGAVQQIRIRGVSSVTSGVEPLFVIDGVPVVSGSNASSGATSSFGVMANLNPNDIESITVLKDASATAPYGARGSNGVIVITTKQGRAGQTQYTISAQQGWNSRAVPGEKAIDAFRYNELMLQRSNGVSGIAGWDGTTSTDWGALIRNEDAMQQEYSVSARGGNATTNFYVSGSVFGQDGPIIGSSLDRLTAKVDVAHRFDNRIRVTNSATMSFAEQDGFLEGAGYFGSPILAEYFMPPYGRAFNDDGSYNITPATLRASIFNPLYIQENDINRKRNYRVLNNTKLDINLADNLAFTSRLAVDFIQTNEKYYRNRKHGDALNFNGSVNDITNLNINWVWQNIVQYQYNLNANNNFTFRVLSETQKNTYEGISATGRGIAADGLVNLNTTVTPFSVGGATSDWGVQSFTGTVNYGWKNRLYADGNFRYEGNSRFPSDQRWGEFWAVGVAYVLTEENFLKNVNFLDYLRVRASYGKTGNASVGLNSYQATVGFGGYGGTPSILTSNLGNQNLSWETALSYDLALEFEMFERISGSATFFRKDSKDLLFNVPLSRTTGHTSQNQNIGELYNQGLELEVNVNVYRSRDLSWTLGGNFTRLKNEVTKLPKDGAGDNIEITSATVYTAVEGYAVRTWFMREWAGVDPANGDPLWYIGDDKTETTNNYNAASFYSQRATALPNLFGGINTRVDFRNFYASANLYYAFGYKIFDNWAFYMRSDGAFYGAFGMYERQYDRWQQPGDVAENPRPVPGGNKNSYQASSRFLYKGDHLRLKDLRFGYNIPQRVLENVGLSSANVYFLGTNLWTHAFDKNLNYDPEARADGFTSLQAPPMKSVTFGVILNF
jgi:TonB-dependent starch-binding outer membrane protein SusC